MIFFLSMITSFSDEYFANNIILNLRLGKFNDFN